MTQVQTFEVARHGNDERTSPPLEVSSALTLSCAVDLPLTHQLHTNIL